MEKRSISGRDILRMDGLLPPTRRLPVCDAVTSSDKKKDKKWSIGGILKRISSIRDYDSSSNDEEMVYCTRQPRPRTVFNRKSHVVLRPVNKDSKRSSRNGSSNTLANTADTPNLQRDSAHSRSSDGSLDGPSKKTRKNKLKAQVEAKRGQICGDSSSDEESRKSCNSLARYQTENAAQKNSSCNRKSRAARTERYIKRLSRDESHRFPEDLNSISNKRNSLDFMCASQSHNMDANELFRPAVQSQHFAAQSNSYTFPVQRSVENLRQVPVQAQSSTDLTKHSTKRYITDLNQNNTYAKPNASHRDRSYKNYEEDRYFSNSPIINSDYARPYDHARNGQSVHQSSSPPEPPPRDPRYKVSAYNCNSFPFNGKSRATKYDDRTRAQMDDAHTVSKNSNRLRSYDSNNEISWCGSTKHYPRRPWSLTATPTQSCSLSECTNNKHNSTGRHVDEEPIFQETEAMRCQRRNNRNEQLNSSFNDYDVRKREKKPSVTSAQNIYNSSSSVFSKALDSPWEKSASKPSTSQEHSYSPTKNIFAANTKGEEHEEQVKSSEQEALERRRSSKNLEEALSELEAIYNSLRLGDEDLLDRAERRSMEEFSLRQARTDDVARTVVDSPDRTKDDMAYRRMHPKERPASLSEAIGQSALSNISYLMTSPILTRKDATDGYLFSNCPARRDEPDVTRDDVVYRSIHRSNNTLKVADPQPPFGIPLGPVATATESDYLHTTPTKPDHPRSSYIPQCEPDIVTDDLAYRTLRKDANAPRNSVDGKGAKDQESALGMKKKRAVRSLSANLYGLINHDRIHLRREPSLQDIKDEIDEAVVDIKSLPARSDCFRRVVSDGELSDYDIRWRAESSLKNSRTDINGNHPVSNVHRKKLRVYVSPSTQIRDFDKEDGTATQISTPSTDILSKALSNEFWQDCVQSTPKQSSNKDTESDFMAYSRLCQDLVNLIEGPSDAEARPIEETADGDLERSAKIDNPDDSNNADDPSILRIQSLGSQYSTLERENGEQTSNKGMKRLSEPVLDSEKEDPEKTDDSAFDFYLRVADENVKLIAEAFSSVADRLRDSRLSQKNSLTSRRSEIETDSTPPDTSTRSSLAYSQDDANDNLSSSSRTIDMLDTVPKDAPVNVEEDREEVEPNGTGDSSTDPELDLSKAVHDLQLAAARLCEHEKEIEELEALLKRDAGDIPCTTNVSITEEMSLIGEKSFAVESDAKEQEREQKEGTIVSTDVKLRSDEHDPDSEGESTGSTECKDVLEPCNTDCVARSTGMRFSYVTNLITVTLTTYSMVLLACFLALLLATIAAS